MRTHLTKRNAAGGQSFGNWSPASRRPQQERDALDKRRVAVEGLVQERSPAPPEPVAYITGPCLSPVLKIRALPEGSNT